MCVCSFSRENKKSRCYFHIRSILLIFGLFCFICIIFGVVHFSCGFLLHRKEENPYVDAFNENECTYRAVFPNSIVIFKDHFNTFVFVFFLSIFQPWAQHRQNEKFPNTCGLSIGGKALQKLSNEYLIEMHLCLPHTHIVIVYREHNRWKL